MASESSSSRIAPTSGTTAAGATRAKAGSPALLRFCSPDRRFIALAEARLLLLIRSPLIGRRSRRRDCAVARWSRAS
ncbi:MAG: hypothetical protein ACJ765_06405, partial [Chloroflexota bacterium]